MALRNTCIRCAQNKSSSVSPSSWLSSAVPKHREMHYKKYNKTFECAKATNTPRSSRTASVCASPARRAASAALTRSGLSATRRSLSVGAPPSPSGASATWTAAALGKMTKSVRFAVRNDVYRQTVPFHGAKRRETIHAVPFHGLKRRFAQRWTAGHGRQRHLRRDCTLWTPVFRRGRKRSIKI